MENQETKYLEWRDDKDAMIASIAIDEKKGIDMKIYLEALGAHRSEMEELLTLGLYPPRDDNQEKGMLSEDGTWINFQTRKGQRWEIAKVDIVNTFRFWFGVER